MRSCTVVRATPSLRANEAVDSRALRRRRESRCCCSAVSRRFVGIVVISVGLYRQTDELQPLIRRSPPIHSDKRQRFPRGRRRKELAMTRIILLGAGKIGETIAHLLHASGDYTLSVADHDATRLAPIEALGVRTVRAEFGSPERLRELIRGQE